MWFKKKTPAPILSANGFALGQVVQHKAGGSFVAVICEIYIERGMYWATVANGDFGNNEHDVRLVELEPFKSPRGDA